MAIVGVAALLIYVNTGGNASGFGALGRYLVIDDRWGTNRGFVWKACLKFWNDLPFVKKLIGYGPETFGILAVQEYYQEMVSLTGYVFDNAHNEYLQYLVTIGVGGLFFYVGSLLTGCARMLKAREKSPYCAAAACAVLCYAAQATVNLCIPIATPVMWLLLSIGVALSKREGE
jgi:O-antigen ligase